MNIVVIGGGPGGYVAAIRAAQLGADVTLIENKKLGGTCLNEGCIPTKALLHSAQLFTDAKKGAKEGVLCEPQLDFKQVQKHKNGIVTKLVGGVGYLLKANKVNVIRGKASFIDESTLSVESKDETVHLKYDKIIIAAGSVPAKLPILGIYSKKCLDSAQVLDLEEVPQSMVIIGGGVIGVEMATAYSAFDTKITIIEMMDEILPIMDAELVRIVKKRLQKNGVRIITSTKVLSIEDAGKTAIVHAEKKGEASQHECEAVLVSVGRRAKTDLLDLGSAGIENDRGHIIVNEHMQTNVPSVYAVGDCTGGSMLAHAASMQGEVAAEHAMGHDAVFNGTAIPYCVFSSPEMACAGITEEQAKLGSIPYICGKFPMKASGKALIMNGGEGMVKIIAEAETQKVIGVHIAGPNATELITEGALAVELGLSLEQLISTIHAHPTIGECLRESALSTLKRSIHIVN